MDTSSDSDDDSDTDSDKSSDPMDKDTITKKLVDRLKKLDNERAHAMDILEKLAPNQAKKYMDPLVAKAVAEKEKAEKKNAKKNKKAATTKENSEKEQQSEQEKNRQNSGNPANALIFEGLRLR